MLRIQISAARQDNEEPSATCYRRFHFVKIKTEKQGRNPGFFYTNLYIFYSHHQPLPEPVDLLDIKPTPNKTDIEFRRHLMTGAVDFEQFDEVSQKSP